VGDREPDLKTLVKIAIVLGTTPDALLGVRAESSAIENAETRMRARLLATIGAMDGSALRLLTLLTEGVLTFVRDEVTVVRERSLEPKAPRRRRGKA
jgi:hypothetical protein